MVTRLARSAKVLDDTDRSLLQMNWLLFAQEQDARLWADDGGWRPGIPLYSYPMPEFGEQHPRLMIQEMPIDYFHIAQLDAVHMYVRCEECETSWYGDEPCFSCGKDCPTLYGRIHINKHFHAEYVEDNVIFWLQGEMARMLDEEVELALSGAYPQYMMLRGIEYSNYSVVQYVPPSPRLTIFHQQDKAVEVDESFTTKLYDSRHPHIHEPIGVLAFMHNLEIPPHPFIALPQIDVRTGKLQRYLDRENQPRYPISYLKDIYDKITHHRRSQTSTRRKKSRSRRSSHGGR